MPGSPPDVDGAGDDDPALEGDDLDDRVPLEWHELEEDALTDGEASIRIVASAAEMLREKSFGDLTEEERLRVSHLIRKLALQLPMRHTRRYRAAVRRAVRRAPNAAPLAPHPGRPFERAWRDRGRRTRPLVLILDISGSMAPYSRALMQFAFAAMAAGRRVEVFCFGTRLTRVTRIAHEGSRPRPSRDRPPRRGLGGRDQDRGVAQGARGRLSQRASIRGSVAVICSDGLERGEPDLLREQMAKLRRLVHKIVWVNPLKGSPHYEPLARGTMRRCPRSTSSLPGHNLESLEESVPGARRLASVSWAERRGRAAAFGGWVGSPSRPRRASSPTASTSRCPS